MASLMDQSRKIACVLLLATAVLGIAIINRTNPVRSDEELLSVSSPAQAATTPKETKQVLTDSSK